MSGVRTLSAIKLVIQMSAALNNTLTDGSVTSIQQPNVNFVPNVNSSTKQPGGNFLSGSADRGWQFTGVLDPAGVAGPTNVTIDLHTMAGGPFTVGGNNGDIGTGAGLDALGQAVDYTSIFAISVQNSNTTPGQGYLDINGTPPANPVTGLGQHTYNSGGAGANQALDAGGMICKVQQSPSQPLVGNDMSMVVSSTVKNLKLTPYVGIVNYVVSVMARGAF